MGHEARICRVAALAASTLIGCLPPSLNEIGRECSTEHLCSTELLCFAGRCAEPGSVFANSFEGGKTGGPITVEGSIRGGAAFSDVVIRGGDSATWDSARAHAGQTSVRFATGAAGAAFVVWSVPRSSSYCVRSYFSLSENVTENLYLVELADNTQVLGAVILQTNGTVGVAAKNTRGVARSMPAPVRLNEWFRLEACVTASATEGVVEARLYSVASSSSPTSSVTVDHVDTGGGIDSVLLGAIFGGGNAMVWMDDAAAAPTPVGP